MTIRNFALVYGIVFLLVGLAGFVLPFLVIFLLLAALFMTVYFRAWRMAAAAGAIASCPSPGPRP